MGQQPTKAHGKDAAYTRYKPHFQVRHEGGLCFLIADVSGFPVLPGGVAWYQSHQCKHETQRAHRFCDNTLPSSHYHQPFDHNSTAYSDCEVSLPDLAKMIQRNTEVLEQQHQAIQEFMQQERPKYLDAGAQETFLSASAGGTSGVWAAMLQPFTKQMPDLRA